jgi:hypothetical protein
MSEPDHCDICTMVVESTSRPVDQASAGFPHLLHGGIGVLGLPTDVDPAGSARSATAKSEICFEGFERRLAFDAWRRDDQFLSIQHDGEAKPIHACSARTASPSGSLGGAVVAQGTYYPGVDKASRGQLGPNGTANSKKRSRRPASTATPIRRRVPKKSGQRKTASRRPRNRIGHAARELFNHLPKRDRSGGLQGLLSAGRLNLSHYLWQDNRVLGLDPYDWFILLGGAAVSGAIVLLS